MLFVCLFYLKFPCLENFLHFGGTKENFVFVFRDHSHVKSSHSLHQHDAKLQTHLPSTLNDKMSNLPKIDVYNFKCKISVRNVIKLFFLSHKYFKK